MKLKSGKIKKHLRNRSRLNLKSKLEKLFLVSQLPHLGWYCCWKLQEL